MQFHNCGYLAEHLIHSEEELVFNIIKGFFESFNFEVRGS